jgi:hypothetical protein
MMDAILISADPVNVGDAIKHLGNHKELYWSVSFRIRKDQLSFPMVGFIHLKGSKVEYKAVVTNILPFSSQHFDNQSLATQVKPKSWRQAWENDPKERLLPWKKVLVMTKIIPFSFNTYLFKKYNGGGSVKAAPQGGIRVIPPPDALSSRNIDDKRRPKSPKKPSPGANVPFTKDGHSADPQHAKIVNALAKALTKDGWNLEHQFECNPDVFATKHDERLLFEIKPDSSKASFYMGLGQLLLYRRDVRECQSFLVVPEDSPEDCLTEEWRTEFREREIGFVTYKTRGKQYYFPKLAVQVRAWVRQAFDLNH